MTVAALLQNYTDESRNKEVVCRLVDLTWIRFDYDNSGVLDMQQAFDFFSSVLQHHENLMAKAQGREPEKVKDQTINKAIKDCDTKKNQQIDRKEMKTWLVRFMRDNAASAQAF